VRSCPASAPKTWPSLSPPPPSPKPGSARGDHHRRRGLRGRRIGHRGRPRRQPLVSWSSPSALESGSSTLPGPSSAESTVLCTGGQTSSRVPPGALRHLGSCPSRPPISNGASIASARDAV
jgi:hypothetical protein